VGLPLVYLRAEIFFGIRLLIRAEFVGMVDVDLARVKRMVNGNNQKMIHTGGTKFLIVGKFNIELIGRILLVRANVYAVRGHVLFVDISKRVHGRFYIAMNAGLNDIVHDDEMLKSLAHSPN